MPDALQIFGARKTTPSPTLRDVASVFFRHRRLLTTSFLVAASLGILYSAVFPSYRAEMKVVVRRGRIDPAITPTPSSSPAFEHDEITEEELNSEVELLRDDDILRQVALETDLANPSWISKLTRQSAEERIAKAVRRLSRKLNVQPVRKSRLIVISYGSRHPEQSAAVLRSLMHSYLAKQAQIQRPSGQQSFFEGQVKESRRALEEAQTSLIAFTRKEGVVAAGLERDLVLQKVSEAEAAQLGVQSALAEATARALELDAKLRELPERRVVQIKNSDNPELLGKLKSKLLELELRRTELLQKFQPSYRLVTEVDEQIAQAKAAIDAEDLKPLRDETTEANREYEWAHLERLKNQVELAALRQKQIVARQQLASYRTEAEQMEERSIAQHDLEQKVKSSEEKWLLYANKREEARIGDALDQSGVVNVAIAQTPRTPAVPVWSFWAASCLSIVGAFSFSTGLVFVADYFDPSFRTPEEVFALLGTRVLASLPPQQQDRASTREAS